MSAWWKSLSRCWFFAAVLSVASVAQAHVRLDHSMPKVGARIVESPKEVRVYFDGELAPGLCCVEVVDSAGKPMDRKDTHIDPKDETCLVVSVEHMTPGTYKVVWRACCPESHKTHGEFKFEIVAGN